jgi:hypothetical protein
VITRVLLSLVLAHGPTLVEPYQRTGYLRDPQGRQHSGPVRALEARRHQRQCNVFRSCLDVRFLVKASFRPDNACQAISRSAPTPRLGEYEKPCRSLCIPRKPAHRTNSGDWVAQIGEPKLGALVCRLTQYRLVPRGSDLTPPGSISSSYMLRPFS